MNCNTISTEQPDTAAQQIVSLSKLKQITTDQNTLRCQYLYIQLLSMG
jgi:hypothetical protein